MNKKLNVARVTKNDEWYTRMEDIRAELDNYKEQFRGKSILCPCDDATWSNFARYFSENFEALGLKRLVCSCYYAPKQTSLYTVLDDSPEMKHGYWAEYKGNDTWERHNYKKGKGDFRSADVTELLQQCDIVVTNPPFSLFREFLCWIFQEHKDLLILGPKLGVTYKKVFPKFKQQKLRLGYHRWFDIRCFDNNGELTKKVPASWYTTLKVAMPTQRHFFKAKYEQGKYKQYLNYPAINIDKINDLPKDYFGIMGVPVSFLRKWNPEQFELVDVSNLVVCPPLKLYKTKTHKKGQHTIYTVGAIFIAAEDGMYFNPLDNKKYDRVFTRIFIKRVDTNKSL